MRMARSGGAGGGCVDFLSMSSELKQLVCDALESDGTLGKIKAQLRSQVIKAIDDQDKSAGGAGISRNMAQSVTATPEGDTMGSATCLHGHSIRFTRFFADRVLAELVLEYLQFHGLTHTASVFVPEAQQVRLTCTPTS